MPLTVATIVEMMRKSRSENGIQESGGGLSITGEGINLYRLHSLVSGLRLESKGIRLSRGVSCLAIARRDYGIKARTAADAHRIMAGMVAEARESAAMETAATAS